MAAPKRDVAIPDDTPTELAVDKHRDYLEHYGETVDAYEFSIAEYLRISGMYWTVTCLDFLSCLETSKRFNRNEVISYVKSCQKTSGGFSPHPNHDEHLLHTLCAVQILATFDAISNSEEKKSENFSHLEEKNEIKNSDLEEKNEKNEIKNSDFEEKKSEIFSDFEKQNVVKYVVSLQQADGSFMGDKWGEIDTRFSLCALASLALLNSLDSCDKEKSVDFLRKCQNFDGGFGTSPGSESHAGMIYCSLASLAILNRLDVVDADRLGLWLAKRQLPSGGLNGRPEKLPDVCYSWWVLASLAIIGRLHWIDADKLRSYILASQDVEVGGIADRPGHLADPFHTLFGVAGLSLLSTYSKTSQKTAQKTMLKKVNPVFCMAQEIIDRLGIQVQILSVPGQ